MGRTMRVNMQALSVTEDVNNGGHSGLGGRGLTSRIVLDEVRATCDPLGPDNKMVFAPGLLGGIALTSAGRLSVGGKSPLTGGIKEANAGGIVGNQLARLGISAIVVEDRPSGKDDWYLLKVDRNGGTLLPAGDIVGLGTHATVARLQERFGKKAGICCIGQAGEKRMRAASVAVTDILNQPNRHAARGGLGAVMGSKQLKAVVVDDSGASRRTGADDEALKREVAAFAKAIIDNPKTKNQALYGTASIVKACNSIGIFPTRNFSSGQFEHALELTGEKIYEICTGRGGEGNPTVSCMNPCVIKCGNIFPDALGKQVVSTLQYETIGLMGSNLGMTNLDAVAVLNALCNDIGLDTIEMGAALGVAAEAGLLEWGDVQQAARLLKEVAEATPVGRVLGQGAAVTGAVFGVERAPVVKGQAMPAYDPRSLKGNGVTYATSPMGADHTAGNAFGSRDKVNQLQAAGQVDLSRGLQVFAAMLDSLGLCIFARQPVLEDPTMLVNMVNYLYGWTWTKETLSDLGRKTVGFELEFNRRAGFTRADDRLPDYMYTEKLPPHNVVFDVTDEEMAQVWPDR
ncbi:MAG: aldehyde ferredoxin oxidoreductase [Firmicutes bacterium]|nr:aldehyde ferredoxin oxidoreductase [Bacillota bacterium]